MKKTKIISTVLATSMLMSLCSCSLFDSDNKNVLSAADEYAQAVISGDAGDIADLMKDGDDYEDALTAFFDKYKNNKSLEDVYSAIEETMTYKIDKGSVESSKKNKKASVDIIYTLADYEEIFDQVQDDDGDLNDYIDAIEENGSSTTIEIKQTVKLVMSHDEWIVKDDDCENLYEVYEFYPEVSSYSLYDIKYIAASDALEDVFDAEEGDDYYLYCSDDYDYVGYYDSAYVFFFYDYSDADVAAGMFEDIYDSYEDMIGNGDFEGTNSACFGDSEGYILLNGECTDYYFDFEDDDCYGGVFFKETTVAYIIATSDNEEKTANVDQFLGELGYPTPNR